MHAFRSSDAIPMSLNGLDKLWTRDNCKLRTSNAITSSAGPEGTKRDSISPPGAASGLSIWASHIACKEEEEGLQGVFKRLRRNGHQLEKGLQMAQRSNRESNREHKHSINLQRSWSYSMTHTELLILPRTTCPASCLQAVLPSERT
jgi:hypothetical protein